MSQIRVRLASRWISARDGNTRNPSGRPLKVRIHGRHRRIEEWCSVLRTDGLSGFTITAPVTAAKAGGPRAIRERRASRRALPGGSS
jgi:hypothetical protein